MSYTAADFDASLCELETKCGYKLMPETRFLEYSDYISLLIDIGPFLYSSHDRLKIPDFNNFQIFGVTCCPAFKGFKISFNLALSLYVRDLPLSYNDKGEVEDVRIVEIGPFRYAAFRRTPLGFELHSDDFGDPSH